MSFDFNSEVKESIKNQSSNEKLKGASQKFLEESINSRYSYNFSWLGRPIIQYPQDLVALQEIIFNTKPDVIIETGIAHGGSLIFYASMLSLLDLLEGRDPSVSKRKVIGIDIEIRKHNLKAINEHPLRQKIDLIEGSSIDKKIFECVRKKLSNDNKVLVSLDSNHTEEHVYEELNLYANLVSKGSYCIVFDTIIQDLPSGSFPERPWDKGNNPKTAVEKWILENQDFEVCHSIDNKLLISCAPQGYIKRK